MTKKREGDGSPDGPAGSLDRRIRRNQDIDDHLFPGGKQELSKQDSGRGSGDREKSRSTSRRVDHEAGPGEQIQERQR